MLAKRHQDLNFHRLFPDLCTSLPSRHTASNCVSSAVDKNTFPLYVRTSNLFLFPQKNKRLDFTAESRTKDNCQKCKLGIMCLSSLRLFLNLINLGLSTPAIHFSIIHLLFYRTYSTASYLFRNCSVLKTDKIIFPGLYQAAWVTHLHLQSHTLTLLI